MFNISKWFNGHITEQPTKEIDNIKYEIDKIINKLTSIDSKFSYLYFYGSCLTKDEKKSAYEDIKENLTYANDRLNVIKNELK